MKLKITGLFIIALASGCWQSPAKQLAQRWSSAVRNSVLIEDLSDVSRAEYMKFIGRVESGEIPRQISGLLRSQFIVDGGGPLFVFEKHSQGRTFYSVYLCQRSVDRCVYTYSLDGKSLVDTFKVSGVGVLVDDIVRLSGKGLGNKRLVIADSTSVNFTIVSEINDGNVEVKEVLFY